jgi:nucleotide-binding universal stress UspA family protein
MIEFKQILCPIDFSDTSARALTYATALAGWYEAQLDVLHVMLAADDMFTERPDAAEGLGPVARAARREQVVAQIRGAIEAAGARNIRSVAVAEEGRAHEIIVKFAAAHAADLIVMGTHGRTGLNRFFLGSVTEKVVRTAPCAVLTIPAALSAPEHEPIRFERILCGVDFSPASLAALKYALDLGRQANGCVTVLHALEYMDYAEEPCEHVNAAIRSTRQYFLDHARDRLQNLLAAEPRTWCEIEEVVAINRAYREILHHAAAAHSDLIVMGAQGSAGIELMLYGSNTQHVVRRATCPVLTVRA